MHKSLINFRSTGKYTNGPVVSFSVGLSLLYVGMTSEVLKYSGKIPMVRLL